MSSNAGINYGGNLRGMLKEWNTRCYKKRVPARPITGITQFNNQNSFILKPNTMPKHCENVSYISIW
jgi:hypothetical protein